MTFEKVIKHFGNRALRLKDVQRYLDAGGDVNRTDPEQNWSLLHFAVEDCNPEIVRLLAARGADLNARAENGWTHLHRAVSSDIDAAQQEARRARELPTVKTLIELGADTTARAEDGLTPRDIAAASGLEALYDSLIGHKVA